jgi:hypothetical protein
VSRIDQFLNLNLGTVAALSPPVDVAFAEHLRRVVLDCRDRPADSKPRKVTLEVTIVPQPQGDVCDDVALTFQVKDTVPVRKSRSYHLGVQRNGQLIFRPENPEDVNQPGLFQGDE